MKARAFGSMLGIAAVTTVGAVLLAPMGAFANPAAPATPSTVQGAPQSLDLDSKAKISARGAAIRLPYSYLCTAGWEGNLSVQVVQAQGNDLASGYTNKSLKCTGSKKDVSLYLQVAAYQGARPFKAGPASVVATLDAYDPKADPCSNGGPCPMAAPAGAMPPMGTFNAASMPAAPTMTSADTFDHSEVQGTITLVD